MSENCGCAGVCGCCEGVEPVTPVTLVNRPGLDALAYRVGTHGRFLETMVAQLSRHELSVPTAERDGDGLPVAELIRPLRGLRTRDLDDPSLALLDAWATVADVLTFYQERIANEGYLRTATERRSVLELGRLLGYRLRPGVAATTFLAYSLEADARTTIAARSKVMSVPLPGELPQTFETVEEAEARGEWNSLQVASTRPVDAGALADVTSDRSRALWFGGVTTRLELNDPLLADFGEQQELFRVVEVTPDTAANRTRVSVRPWQTPPPPAPPPSDDVALEAPVDEVAQLEGVVERYTDRQAAGAPKSTAAVRRVVDVLERLRTNLLLGLEGKELRALVAADILPAIEAELRANRRPSAPVAAWLERLVEELAPFRPAGTTAEPSADAGGGDTDDGASSIGDALTSLATPPSTQPASPRDLEPGLDTTFGSSSDVLPSLLTVMRPELAPVLYDAWRNLEATPPSQLRIYALRTRASAFGHNAPLDTVRTDEGIVTATREWTLQRDNGVGIPEDFALKLSIPDSQFGSPPPIATISVQVADASAEASVSVGQLLQGPYTLALGASEQVVVTLTAPRQSPVTPGSVAIVFAERGMTFSTTLERSASLTWSSQGSDPTMLTYSLTGGGDELSAGKQRWRVQISGTHRPVGREPTEDPYVVSLDATRPAIVPGGWAVVQRPAVAGSPPRPGLIIARVAGVRDASRADYGITGRSTLVELDRPWLALGASGDTFTVIRESAIYVQSEALELLDEPLDPVLEPVCDGEITLDRLYDGLQPGRRLIVAGERADVTLGEDAPDAPAVPGVRAVEVVMLAAVRQDFDRSEPAAKTRTTLVLAAPLAYCYRRDTLTIYGNVLKATHGETLAEVLGSGDGTRPNQAFELKQKPLTHVSAITPTGVSSTLEVAVDGVVWHEADSPVGLSPTDRRWVPSTGDDDVTSVTFGNGAEGARLPTGQENVSAVYRFGIGAGGNVAADQLSLLGTRPGGVVSVTNPERASGGANREGRDQARRNIPLAVTALDRIVSVQDYADFARTFAGIAKASATRLADGRQELVHVTIAGEEDIPILPTSDLYANLRGALATFGDRFQPFRVEVRALRLMVAVIKVAVHPDHRWEIVEPAIRAAMADRFGFARRELGQDVVRSEVLSVVQGVAGVVYADTDILDTIDERAIVEELTHPSGGGLAAELRLRERLRAHLARTVEGPPRAVRPAELVVLNPAAAQTLTLLEIDP